METHVSAYAADGQGCKLGGGTTSLLRRCFQRAARMRTTCAEAERTRTYAGVGELERGFEIAGINHFLRARGENAAQTRAKTASAMANRQATIVFDIEPRLPRKRAVDLEPICKLGQGMADEDWVVVSFHTVPAEELIDERPDEVGEGTTQRRYLG